MQPFYFYRKGIVLWERKGKKWKKSLGKDPVDLDAVCEESQEQGNTCDKDYTPEEKKG